ncbi:MAG TPA: hypothetical protein PLZ45_03255 [Ferruginibacter sp.]|nr:hypothetical protein [Ferruginibacter sp.]
MKRFTLISLVTAIIMIVLSLSGIFYLWLKDVHCDELACVGVFAVMMPVFLFGLALTGIVLLTVVANHLYKLFYKQRE